MVGIVDPLVTTAWLAERLGDADIRVVDATLPLVGQPGHGRDSYVAGHIPGAVFFDINAIADPDTDLPHMLPTPAAFAEAGGALGLDRAATIVVYDAHGIFSAPRVWWTLRVMGYANVFVLDGGLKVWRAEGRAIDTSEPKSRPVQVEPAFNARLVADLAAVTEVLAIGSAQVIDARAAARFTGETPEPRATLRSGHMPGALNLPFNLTLNSEGRMLPPDQLREALSHVDVNAPIVTTCGSGITASILALALARLGRFDVAVYDGSWTEWGARSDTAVVTGA